MNASDLSCRSTSGERSFGFSRLPAVFVLAVACLGFSAFLTQLTLMRELLCVFSGNELVFGIVLGSWMLLTGLGAVLGRILPGTVPIFAAGTDGGTRLRVALVGRKNGTLPILRPIAVFVIAQILIAVLPIVDVFALRSLHNVIFLRGVEVGVTETVASCLALLAPYCGITGYLLTVACGLGPAIANQREKVFHHGAPDASLVSSESAGIGRVYFWDNLGDVLGGVLFTFVLVERFDHFVILYVAAILNLLFAGLMAALAGRRALAAASGAVLAGLLVLAACCNLDDLSRRLEFAAQEVVFHGASPYGSLVVTKSAGELDFIENGIPLFSTHNLGQVEETVHYAMAQRPGARRVLLVSGGASGTACEVLKYPVEAVDYVELDPLILSVARRLLPDRLADPRIHVHNTDGRLFVRQTNERYDVVIVDMPPPSTSQINRFYTQEFFAEAHRILTPGGVLAFPLESYENYLSKELARIIGVEQRTLAEVYRHVLILPGGRLFFLASDDELTTDVAGRLEEAGVAARLVNRNYLRGMLTPDRLADVARARSADLPINKDFNPILYYYHLRYWMSQYQARFGLFEGVLLILLLVYVIRLRPIPLVVFCGGFAGSALEVVLLVAFQILFGSLYYQVGWIVTMFMLGLVIGASWIQRRCPTWQRGHLVGLAVAIAALSVCIPLLLLALGQCAGAIGMSAAQVAIPLLTLILAVPVGMEFPLAAKIDCQDAATTSSRLYTADYLGAALGALLVSTLLIPVLGVINVCLLAAGLNLLGAFVMLVRRG